MREVLLPCVVVLQAVPGLRADVVDNDLQVHLGLTAKALDVSQKVSLIGSDGATESVVVLKGGTKAERKYGRSVKAAGDHTCVIPCSYLGVRSGKAGRVLGQVFRNDDGKIGGGKEEDLVSEEPGNPGQRHRTTMTGQLRESAAFSNAIGVPCHIFCCSCFSSRRKSVQQALEWTCHSKDNSKNDRNRSGLRALNGVHCFDCEADTMPVATRLARAFLRTTGAENGALIAQLKFGQGARLSNQKVAAFH